MLQVFDVFLQGRFKIALKLASVDSSVYLKHALRLQPDDHILTLTEQLVRVRDHEVLVFLLMMYSTILLLTMLE